MNRLKRLFWVANSPSMVAVPYTFHDNFYDLYFKELTERPKIKRKLKVVAACGNGTAGALRAAVLEALGCEVIPLDTKLDHTFPRYNPNPKTWRCCMPSPMP